jgi:hypothetical protein
MEEGEAPPSPSPWDLEGDEEAPRGVAAGAAPPSVSSPLGSHPEGMDVDGTPPPAGVSPGAGVLEVPGVPSTPTPPTDGAGLGLSSQMLLLDPRAGPLAATASVTAITPAVTAINAAVRTGGGGNPGGEGGGGTTRVGTTRVGAGPQVGASRVGSLVENLGLGGDGKREVGHGSGSEMPPNVTINRMLVRVGGDRRGLLGVQQTT